MHGYRTYQSPQRYVREATKYRRQILVSEVLEVVTWTRKDHAPKCPSRLCVFCDGMLVYYDQSPGEITSDARTIKGRVGHFALRDFFGTVEATVHKDLNASFNRRVNDKFS